MNILIIGNGFDLAHGLPTKYGNFLDFCERARRIYTYREDASLNVYKCDNLDNWEMNDDIKNVLLEAFDKRNCKKTLNDDGTYNWIVTTPNVFLDELCSHIDKNTWLEYFLNCRPFGGENWIDFEVEISKVIQSLDELRTTLKKGEIIKMYKRRNKEF